MFPIESLSKSIPASIASAIHNALYLKKSGWILKNVFNDSGNDTNNLIINGGGQEKEDGKRQESAAEPTNTSAEHVQEGQAHVQFDAEALVAEEAVDQLNVLDEGANDVTRATSLRQGEGGESVAVDGFGAGVKAKGHGLFLLFKVYWWDWIIA